MSLRFAILTALSERSGTGLELARRFDRSIGFFWTASHQQIYRELDSLQTAGLVETQAPEGPPGRGQPKRFEISPTGREALRDWVGQVDEPAKLRSTLAVRLRAVAGLDDDAGFRAVVAHHLAEHRDRLETYRQIEARDFTAPDGRTQRLQHVLLQGGIAVEQAWADWCENVLTALDDPDDT